MPTDFRFDFEPPFRVAGLVFGVTPATALVTVDEQYLSARFGLWRVRTPRDNVAGAEITGPYGVVKTIGPAHLSLADRGLTFATNRRHGVCVRFREPVTGIDPTGRIRHPALTVTVADCAGLTAELNGRPV